MRIVLFLDLDDTIFQTAPKCPPGEPVRVAALARDGLPLSFMTDRQSAIFEMFRKSATIVPVTARSHDAFRRVNLPFDHAAIVAFGGVVLAPGGELDKTWDAEIRPKLRATAEELHAALRQTEAFIAEQGATARIISEFDLPLYLVAKHPLGDSAKLEPIRDEWLRFAETGRFHVHFNDNNLSLVPACLGKEHAVRHVLRTYFADEPVVTLGMGDSLSDAAFLEMCDFSLMPRGCQLARHRSNAGGRRCSAAATTPPT
jgi:hydroxymethylpyrimidine pyrophosphatase-like HAD family hydrolase